MDVHIQKAPHVNGGNGHTISGFSLAHCKIGYDERLRLAGWVAIGVYRYIQTDVEIADSFGVSASMLCKAVKDLEEQGFKRNGGGSAAFIVEELKVASDSVLDQVVSGVGVGRMWDSISRIIG